MEVFTMLFLSTIMCVIVYICTLWKTLKTFQYAGIPYVPGFPLIGNVGPALLQKLQIGELYEKFYYKFSDTKYFGIFDCNAPVIMIRDPELIKQIAIKNADKFIDHYGFTTDNDKVFGKTLFSLKGDRWRNMRSFITPLFTSSKLKQTFITFTSNVSNMAQSLEDSITQGQSLFQIKDFISRCTSDIMCKYAFGIDVDSLRNRDNEIYVTGQKIFAFKGILSTRFLLLKSFPLIAKIFQIPLFEKKPTDYFISIIKNIIEEREQHNIGRTDLVQLLVDACKTPSSKVQVDKDDVIAHTFSFFFGGFDTTASYLSSCLHELATNQYVQQKLMDEIDEVNKKTHSNPKYEDIMGMAYMDRVLMETGRFYPLLPYLERMCTETFVLPPCKPGCSELTVYPGTVVYFPTYAMQRDPQYYENPDKFNPDRFLEQSINSDCGYYMPFGTGRRICIGTRFAMVVMKVLLFNLLLRFQFKPSDQTNSPMKLATNSFILMSSNDYWLQVNLRSKN